MGDVRLAKTPSRWARYLTTGFEQRGSSRATDLSRWHGPGAALKLQRLVVRRPTFLIKKPNP